MAIIGKLQKRSTLILSLIGISILGFVLTDALQYVTGTRNYYVGKMNGTSISNQEYEKRVQNLGQQNPQAQQDQIRNQVWNDFVFQYVYQPEFNKLGIQVTGEEFNQMLSGDSIFIHSQIRAQFQDSTGKFDKTKVQDIINNVRKASKKKDIQSRNMLASWTSYREGLEKTRKFEKYQALLANSNYITSYEAKRNYEEQTAKSNVNYLYIPFSSIVDSTIQVEDEKLEEYLNKSPKKYEAKKSVSLGYVIMDVKPSKDDSLALVDDLRSYAKSLGAAKDDSAFVASLGLEFKGTYQEQSLQQIPSEIFEKNPVIRKGGVYGPVQVQVPIVPTGQQNPFQQQQMRFETKYRIFKVSEEIEDSIAYARARHILVKIDTTQSAEVQAEVREKAQEILERVQSGEDFAQIAQKESEDPGSGSKGGDLGWFQRTTMVKPFADAVFNKAETGIVPNLIKSQFGYHIIEVTNAPMKKKYKIASVDAKLNYSDDTKDELFLQANKIISQVKDYESLKAYIEKDSSLNLKFEEQENLQTASRNLGREEARNAILWAFQDDVKANQVSCPIFLDNEKYVIVAVKSKFKEGELSVDAYKNQLTAEAIKGIKTDMILKKLEKAGNLKKDKLESLAKKYGKDAQTNTANDLLLNSSTFGNVGSNPAALGKSFGLKKGKRSQVFADETGIFILEVQNTTPAPKIADYNKYKTDLENLRKQRTPGAIGIALNEIANVQDNRYKFETADPCKTQ